MKFGLVKTSLIDYPGEIAAVLFTRGCNLRCPYCHNPGLVTGPEPRGMLGTEEVLNFLRRRRNVLDGVCITGGEPLLHPDIPDFLREIRRLGFKVKLDTNGTLPGILERVEADYIAMDIKTLPEKYPRLLPADGPESTAGMAAAVRESAAWLMASGIEHEFRTTAAPGIFGEEDIGGIAEMLRGARVYVLAAFRPGNTLDPEYGENHSPYAPETLLGFQRAFLKRGIGCLVRGISGEGT